MEEPTNIRRLFSTAKSFREQVDAPSESSSSAFLENLRAAIVALDECRKLADRIALFSSNETQDDISSADLQYEPSSGKGYTAVGMTDGVLDTCSSTITLVN